MNGPHTGFTLLVHGVVRRREIDAGTGDPGRPRRTRPAVEILDGDEVRTNLSKGLGFSKEDRD